MCAIDCEQSLVCSKICRKSENSEQACVLECERTSSGLSRALARTHARLLFSLVPLILDQKRDCSQFMGLSALFVGRLRSYTFRKMHRELVLGGKDKFVANNPFPYPYI